LAAGESAWRIVVDERDDVGEGIPSTNLSDIAKKWLASVGISKS
jgi:hypothetical protein